MADLFWDNDNDLPALDLFDPTTALPPLDGFATSPLLSEAGLGVHFPEPSLEPELPSGHVILAASCVPSVNLAPEEANEFSADDLLSIPTPPSQSITPPDGSVDDEFFSERGSSGNSSNHELLPPTTSLSSTASDLTTGITAVEVAKRKAEQYANDKASDRKRKSSAKSGGNSKRQKKGAEGSSCSDGDDNDEENDAPEKVSHRKYQKRLQKNRDSAYVSRIRRREYARILEDSLERTEKEKNAIASRYDTLQRKFDVIVQELNTLKEATAARFGSVANTISAPVGSASMPATKPKAGAIVTTMFMFALMFGCMVPGSLNSKSASPSNFNSGPGTSFVSSNYPIFGPRKNGDNGKVWDLPNPSPLFASSKSRAALLQTLSSNVTQLFGKDRAGEVMKLMNQKIDQGVVSEKALLEIAVKAQSLADNIEEDNVKQSVQSRKSAIFQSVMRRLAAAADECFTKELVALLTVRLIPQPGNKMRAL